MNKTLMAGLTITLLILVAALFGRYFAPYDISEHVPPCYQVDENGQGTLIAPPYPPSAGNPFGTDRLGVDMMAKVLDGAKYTIIVSILIAAIRVVVGGVLGMLLGYVGKGNTAKADRLPIGKLLNGIPVFIIVWMMMRGITINPMASPLKMTIMLSVVLAVVGIPAVTATVKEKTLVIREKQFILSAKSIGASRWTIIRKHLFPHLQESFLILFVQEIVLILAVFGQLGLFNIFVGGTTLYPDRFDPVFVSRTNEWGGLIGQARSHLDIYQWELFFPLLIYMVFILGFHMISVGLEKLFKRRFSKYAQI
ncbi:ABC transporter permease [Paenibacillus silvisoli]|uniref:ABC transporter permease n=1 Tax=Paenibacillus silvisoli TaxID=3110539 RepID=UPI0028052C44|nr:ABC transporter permease subunit [Paenibacillus silvisoli]